MDIRLASLTASALLAGCSTSVERLADRNGFDVSMIDTGAFRHVIVSRHGTGDGQRLYVYVEGDGMPWVRGVVPAPDPTPADPLALRLMARQAADPAAALVYLGRPCYFGLAEEPGCDPSLWTAGRYSAPVVSSMVAATNELIAAGDYTDVVLIGFSGGGTVTRLMAPQLDRVAGVLTVNANLHVAAWVSAHGYQPLSGSLDPIDEAPLPPQVLHVQAVGSRDSVVPRSVTDSYRVRHTNVLVWHYTEYDHVCCWLEIWPTILAQFDRHLSTLTRR